MKKKLIWGLIILLIILATIGYSYKKASDSRKGTNVVTMPVDREVYYEGTYASYLESNGYQGKMSKDEVVVDIKNYKTENGATAKIEPDGLKTSEEGKVSFEFDVKKDGFYNLEIGYKPVKNKNSSVERKMYLDGKMYFKGMEQIVFKREWVNETKDIEKRNGNEIRPNTIEVINEKTEFIEDAQRRMIEPYKFYLDKGKHTIAFEAVREPVKFTSIIFKANTPTPTYEEFLQKNEGAYPLYEGELLIGQAERNVGITADISKSSRAILINSNYQSPQLEPSHHSDLIFNTIGGDSFNVQGDNITWEIEAPKKGLYQLSFTAKQSANRGGMSYRKLMINGSVPFKEVESVGFGYSQGFKNYVIGNENGPLLIPLEEGKNKITLETVLGQMDKPVTEVTESLFVLNDAYRKIIQLIGTVPNTFIDYEVEKKIPHIKEVFGQEYERLSNVLKDVISISGQKGEDTVTLDKLIIQLEKLKEDPEKIVKEHNQFKNNISSLGLWSMKVSSMPLEIDQITISKPTNKLIKTEAGFFGSTFYETKRFISTFLDDNTKISGDFDKNQEHIKVWIGTGRDQAQVIMNLIEETFTPKTGINVSLELIPESVIIPSTLTGKGPDVVVGLTEPQVMNFAVRNALVNLKTFNDFKDKYDDYEPSAFEGITFKDGIFGMPEQQTFMMMFYREDILKEIGLEIPKTFEEVKEMIPILQMYNYDFYLPSGSADPTSSMYASLVYQAGGDMYLGKGDDYGIETGLYEEKAMQTFQDYTQFYTSYHLPVVADFANRFRTGEVPIGIAPYTTYAQLQVSAPEIRGLWSFAPIPGKEQKDGSIDNTVVSTTTQSILMENSKHKETAWEFIKWWTSEETQLQYGTMIEGIMGPAARYASANIDVLEQLPWSVKEAKALINQFESTKGLPEVPGGYMTARMVTYAFKNVVTDGQNPREALYLNAKSINDELTKKRKEFNLSTVETK